ncbi:hypothetical protein KM914_05260 [Virgibacillus pantothenticus]|uniref:hypothetical protein n=1 Tax=Virgibacillus pantothenticus TaxID=1473 RepID=UPI000FFF384C|nr:hypothetical protein [Virgibacillus pantothenticus]MBS7428622.1 hypothetical protein [Virgibacillus sp. 19R1-5]MBU8565849.1 hypothetical protein [Virgibacillus pantothenticus]MBU8645965.1 hypothetical protein [Virgibacillus pantothenticus]MBU8668092.1 hypothetical protein [Virgibacillus pantothenticus]MBU8672318.1 hypothetical protein [Virgibacillus pantothenticus]
MCYANGYRKLFRDMDNDIVKVSNQLSEQHKRLLFGTIGYLFIQRKTGKAHEVNSITNFLIAP